VPVSGEIIAGVFVGGGVEVAVWGAGSVAVAVEVTVDNPGPGPGVSTQATSKTLNTPMQARKTAERRSRSSQKIHHIAFLPDIANHLNSHPGAGREWQVSHRLIGNPGSSRVRRIQSEKNGNATPPSTNKSDGATSVAASTL
jgi:hypothetical protein